MTASPPVQRVTVIHPHRGWAELGFRELWEYRELLFFLTWRDVKVRYKQTVLGIAWAVLQPLLTMVVFSVFLGRLGKMPSDGLPYPIFSFAALVPWTFFAHGLNDAANSVVAGQQLITKVYFPRLAIPIASVFSGFVDLAIALTILVLMMLAYGIVPTSRVVWVAPLLVLAFTTTLAVGLWLSALNVKYRDVRYAVPFLTNIWLFATPIAYPSSLLEAPWREVYALNPMVGVVEGFRWALLGSPIELGPILATSSLAAVAMQVSGLVYFRRMETQFADIV